MSNDALVWVIWLAKTTRDRLGAWGIVAIFSILTAMYFYWQPLNSLRTEIENNRAQLQTAKHATAEQANRHANQQIDAQQEFAENAQQKLLKVAEIPALLTSILKQASLQKITLNQGHYTFTKVANRAEEKSTLAVSRYEMQLPIKGNYTKMRDFLSAVLHAHPMLAVSKLQFKRENVFLSEIEAELVFVIFVRE